MGKKNLQAFTADISSYQSMDVAKPLDLGDSSSYEQEKPPLFLFVQLLVGTFI